MTNKTIAKITNFLNITLILSLILVTIGFGYWFSMQIEANQANLVNTSLKNSIKNRPEAKRSPNIGLGVKDSKKLSGKLAASTSNLNLSQTNFEAAACSKTKTKPSQSLNSNLKLSQDGLYGVSKNHITLKAVYGNTLIYGQKNLDQDMVDYMLCVIDITTQTTATKLQLDLNQKNGEYLNTPTRIIIYDNLSDYTSYYRQVYGQKLGDSTPWGLSESDTISTFLRLRSDNAIITNQEFQDIRYRLTYNLGHEYFHQLFGTIRSSYVPFIEEGLAVFMAGKVTKQVLGDNMSCTYRASQAKLASQKTVDLKNIVILADSENWYKSNNLSELYADAYYFISDLDQNQELPSFIQKFLKNPDQFEKNQILSEMRPEFAANFGNLLEIDKIQCGQ